ncbi:LuxR family transcriptional regulator [Devosia sp. 2618]|uniref:helix-turn-helix transcriptional regulator n=1 Tax=Devosia sp. 2618 TaxID=3156454 RepID=UPI0033907A73
MVSFEDFVVKTNEASDAGAVFELFRITLADLGFDRVVYSLITDPPSLDKLAGHGIQHSYPQDWMEHYTRNGYERIDPVPKYCFASSRPFTWDRITNELPLSDEERKVMLEAHEAHLRDGVGMPLYGPNGEIAGLGLASSEGGTNLDRSALYLLRAMAYQFHLAYWDHEAPPNPLGQVHLTAREREILLWAAEGKSDPVIAELLGISYPTVRYHMANIFAKLGVNERTLAVVKALRYGLIIPSFVGADYQTR